MKKTISNYLISVDWNGSGTCDEVTGAMRQALEDMREECAGVCERIAGGDVHGYSDWCSPLCHGEDASTIRSIKIE